MLSEKQLKTMLSMQNIMNSTIDKDWAILKWDYMRAIAIETAEAVEHHGWKWWKAQKKNVPQLQMEMVDIWHFYLARYLQVKKGNEEETLAQLMLDFKSNWTYVNFDEKVYKIRDLDSLSKLDLICGLACAKRLHIGLFFSACEDFGLTMESIYLQYVQKNALNIFRQKNGYKEGTYHKIWLGEEDNEVLVSLASELDGDDVLYAEKLWEGLEKRYAKVIEANKG